MIKICPACGKEFETKWKAKNFCSYECNYKSWYAVQRAKRLVKFYKKVCPVCGREFKTKFKRHKICSDACRKIYQKEYKGSLNKTTSAVEPVTEKTNKRVCFACGKSFERNFANEKFCSDKCRLKYFNV